MSKQILRGISTSPRCTNPASRQPLGLVTVTMEMCFRQQWLHRGVEGRRAHGRDSEICDSSEICGIITDIVSGRTLTFLGLDLNAETKRRRNKEPQASLKRTYYTHFQVHTCLHALMFKKLFIFLILPVLQHLFSPSV